MNAITTQQILLLLHAGVTLAMSGLIWFVQIVHYPLFRTVGEQSFAIYEASHSRLTGYVVGPLMVAELVTAICIALLYRVELIAWLGLVLLGIIWWSTFFLQVPQHRRLTRGFDPGSYRMLVRTNWIRTTAWSIRGVMSLVMIRVLG